MIGVELVNRVVVLMHWHVVRETSFLNSSDGDWFCNIGIASGGRLDLV